MAAVTSAPGLPVSRFQQEDSLSTIRDPRSPGDDFPSPKRSTPTLIHPDLNIEVATLSNKLISAINHQTHLDDALAATRQELETAQETIRRLEAENQEHKRLVSTGALVDKSDAEEQTSKLATRLSEERRRRAQVEKDKKGIEQELENLSAALFEEANEMVAVARKEREASEKRNDQLRTQLKDTEALLASHQEQLALLKAVMQDMKTDNDEQETNGSTAPSTPALASQADKRKSAELDFAPQDEIVPAPPTSFPNLLSPVLRTDLQAYEDFRALMEISRKSAPSSRVNSGSYGGLQIPGLTTGASSTNNSTASLSTPSNSSQPAAAQGSVSPGMQNLASPMVPLKETKFYKRALTEDIEPTLRLDTSPGLSWLARRTVINSMCEGSLVVEPMPTSTKMSVFSCSLCGENRRGLEFGRTHRFRTNESENAQRYPLCTYCLNRLRSSCDYLGFLRMVKDGHWRTDGAEAEKSAWEESVRLRERMFWARVGGGVVPNYHGRDSPRASVEASKSNPPFSAPPTINGVNGVYTPGPTPSKENDDAAKAETPSLSVSRPGRARKPSRIESDEDDWETAKKAAIFDDAAPPKTPDRIERSLSPTPSRSQESLSRASLRESLRPKPRSRAASYEIASSPVNPKTPKLPSLSSPVPEDKGLQISIPGGFGDF